MINGEKDIRDKMHTDELSENRNLEELGQRLLIKLSDNFSLDGFCYYLPTGNSIVLFHSNGQWIELDSLPESLVKEAAQTAQPLLIQAPQEESRFNPEIDAGGEEKVSSLMVCPLNRDEEETKGEVSAPVIAVWKRIEKEKEQVMVPLMVGDQVVGMTTKTRSIVKQNLFSQEDLERLCSMKDDLLPYQDEILSLIEKQKSAIVNNRSDGSQDLFASPQEIIASLINILVGMKYSLDGMEKTAMDIQRKASKASPAYPLVERLLASIRSLKRSVADSSSFTSQNEIVKNLIAPQNITSSLTLFKNLFEEVRSKACEKKIPLNFYFDPKIPQSISINYQAFFIFIQRLLSQTISDAKEKQYYSVSIHSKNNHTALTLTIKYSPKDSSDEYRSSLLKRLETIEEESSNDLINEISHKQFIRHGGRISIDSDGEQIFVKSSFPINVVEPSAVLKAQIGNHTDVALILSPETDYTLANTIALYLFNLGIPKDRMVASNSPSNIKKSISHLILFESKMQGLSSEELSRLGDPRVLLVKNSCESTETTYHDYSLVDSQIDTATFYMIDLCSFVSE